MHFLRQAVAITAIVFLPIFLFLFGLTFSLYQVFGSSTSIENALKQSGAYETIAQDSLNAVPTDEDGEEVREGIPLDNPEVQRIFQDAMPPDFLEQQTTTFLDAVYAWVRGDVSKLQFTIDLSNSVDELVNGLASYAGERAASLPNCTDPENIDRLEALDVFNVDCVPPGFGRQAAAAQVRNELNSMDVLSDPVITAENLAGEQGESPEQQLEGFKNIYNILLITVYVTGVASLLLMAAIVFLSPKWRVGLRRTGIVAVVIGSISALMAWTGAMLVKSAGASLAEGAVQATFADVLSILAANVRNWWLGYGITLIVLGIAMLVIPRFIKSNPAEEKLSMRSKTDKPQANSKSASRKTAER